MHATRRMAKNTTSKYQHECCNEGGLQLERVMGVYIMVVRVMEFSNGGTKLERFLPKNQHIQRKSLNFEN